MVSLTVYNRTGGEVGSVDVDVDAIAPVINKQLLHDAVVMYQANQRQGTHRTKSRAEVSGSTKKMYRQKGTGNARAGSKRSGVRRGGGHIFARRNRDYSYRMPKKAVRLATRMAIASKFLDGEVLVLDELDFSVPATREMVSILSAVGIAGQTTLVAVDEYSVNAYKSTRNIPGVSMLPVSDLNALSVLKPRKLLVTKAAIEAIVDRARGVASAVGSQGDTAEGDES